MVKVWVQDTTSWETYTDAKGSLLNNLLAPIA